MTLLRDRDRLLPLDARTWHNVAVVGVSDTRDPPPISSLVQALRRPLANVASYTIDGRTRGDEAAAIVAAVAKARTLVLAVRERLRTDTGKLSLPSLQAAYARKLADRDMPPNVGALGHP